ncbi:MAG: YiiX/YebB-like N1pC/P60 family cysteine hydrolase [Bacteroidales bacterium]|jgi:hypothetical protein|nr:YiiX/YebB-like N1pC/P60 family cysteine hydrolase [Bacteroidales bacterium]
MLLRRKTFLLFACIFLCIISCKPKQYEPLPGDLLFQINADSDFSEAIIRSTENAQNYNFSHVGIVETDGDAVFVIEAVPEYGVRKVTLSQFLNASAKSPKGKPLVVACRLKQDVEIQNPVKNAHLRLGMPYDSIFSHDNQAYYCSELVYKTFLDMSGDYVFKQIPMSFSDTSGNALPYWENYFAAMNLSIPEGEPGTNPTQIFQSEDLEVLHRYW